VAEQIDDSCSDLCDVIGSFLEKNHIVPLGASSFDSASEAIQSWMSGEVDAESALIEAGMNSLIKRVHTTANDAGWYRDPATGEPIKRNFGEVVALMHSELSEALEADRKGLMDDKLPHRRGQEVEFADAVIRIMDTCAALGFDLVGAILEKDTYNRQREDHKLEARAAGGKKY
jgi:hypothetical protein